jgi:predicted RNase H-like HicB family nuclease
MRYGYVVEQAAAGYSAYVPDLPGCVATGKTKAQVRQRIQEAVEIHLKSMIEDGDPIPEPVTHSEFVDMTKPGKKPRAGRSSRLPAP